MCLTLWTRAFPERDLLTFVPLPFKYFAFCYFFLFPSIDKTFINKNICVFPVSLSHFPPRSHCSCSSSGRRRFMFRNILIEKIVSRRRANTCLWPEHIILVPHLRAFWKAIEILPFPITISLIPEMNPTVDDGYGLWCLRHLLKHFFLLPLSGSVFSSSINFFLPRFGCLFFICLLSALTKVCLCRMSIVAKREKNTEAATWYQRIIVTLSKHYWSCIKQYLLPSLGFKEFNEFNESSKDFKDDLRSA